MPTKTRTKAKAETKPKPKRMPEPKLEPKLDGSVWLRKRAQAEACATKEKRQPVAAVSRDYP
jgi:hypothetical protein